MNPAVASPVGAKRAPPPVSGQLVAASKAIEVGFLEAGEVLGQTVDGLGLLIASLDALCGEEFAQTVASTTGDLKSAAADLIALPTRHTARGQGIERLAATGQSLGLAIEDVRRELSYLRILGISVKIVTASIPNTTQHLIDFAREICECIERGSVRLEHFDADLQALRVVFDDALRQEASLAGQCGALLDTVPQGLNDNAAAMITHNRGIADAAVEIGGLARAIRKKVGSALGGLQIGDSTRQRIEHVSEALDLAAAETNLSSDQYARLEVLLGGLLSAQLGATVEVFRSDFARVGDALAGIASDASEILRLRDLSLGRSTEDDQGILRRLESHVGHALVLVDEMSVAEDRAMAMGGAAVAATSSLAGQITGLLSIQTDVQQMALNAALKCTRIGDAGKPLRIIASELGMHAVCLRAGVQAALEAVSAMSMDARLLSGSDSEEAGATRTAAEVGAQLSEVTQRLRQAGDSAESDLAAVAQQGDAVVDTLRRAVNRLDFQRQIGVTLDEAALMLAGGADRGAPETEDFSDVLNAILAQVNKSYTMVQERQIHGEFLADCGIEAEAEASDEAPAPADDGLF